MTEDLIAIGALLGCSKRSCAWGRNACKKRVHMMDAIHLSSSIFHCLRSIGVAIPVIELNQVIQGLDCKASSPWSKLSCNPRSAPSTKAKLYTYSNWFRLLSNPYFILHVAQPDETVCFRLSSYALPMEAGKTPSLTPILDS